MPTNCRNKKRVLYLLACRDAGNSVENVGEFAPPVASVPAGNDTSTSALTPASASVNPSISTTHLIPSDSFSIAGGPRTRKWCFHPARHQPHRRRAVPCSVLQQPAPRSFLRKSRRLSLPVRQTYSGDYDFLANTHFTFPDTCPLSSVSNFPTDAEGDAEVVDSDNGSVLSFEPDCCDCGDSMHVHDSMDEAESKVEDSDDGSIGTYESAETYTVLRIAQETKAEVIKYSPSLPLNTEDVQAIESDNEPLLSSEPECCSCGDSMHVHDSVVEAESAVDDSDDESVAAYESVETYNTVYSAKDTKVVVVKNEKVWHFDSFLEAVGVAARNSVQQVKAEVAKSEKHRRLDFYLEAIGVAAGAEYQVIEVYYCPTSPPIPFPNAPPRVPALTDYPSTPSHSRPGSSALDRSVYVASASHPSISALGFPGRSARAAPQVRQAASPSPSLLASVQSYCRTSFESYASGYTTGYAADASDDDSDGPSSSCFSSLWPSSSGASISSSVAAAPSANGPQENQMVPTWYDIAIRRTFLPHVMPSVSTIREPSPARSGRRVGFDTHPSSRGLAVMTKQPSYIHPSLGPSVRTVYEICSGQPDKRRWKKPETQSQRKRKRRFFNKFTRMFGGYQNADPIDEKPSRDRGRGNKIPCRYGWMIPKRAKPPKRADTPMPSVVGTEFSQDASTSSKATAVTTSPSSKKSSSSGFPLFGLFKKNNMDNKKDKGKDKSGSFPRPSVFSSGFWSTSSSRAPVVCSFKGPTLCRPILGLSDVKQEAPLTAMEINALLSAMMPVNALPPVKNYDAGAGITPATPQRIFSSVPTVMAPTRRTHTLRSTHSDQQRFLKVPHNNLVNYAGAGASVSTDTSTAVIPTIPLLKPMLAPVQDVPILILGPFAPRFVSIEQVLDSAPASKPEEQEVDEDDQPNGAAQVVSMNIHFNDDDDDDDPDYWYKAYAENPNPIPIVKNKSLERSLRSYHPGNRNSRLEPSTLPACLLANDGNDNDVVDLFESGNILSNSDAKGNAVCREPRAEIWRSFSPGTPPLNTIREASTDEEADDEFSTLASTEYAGSSSSEDPDEVDLADMLLLERVIRVYGRVVVNAALVAAHATGTKFDIHELIFVLERNFDPEMFKKGYDLPEKNTPPGIRRQVGGEPQGREIVEEEDNGAGVGKYAATKTRNCLDRGFQNRRGCFEIEEEITCWTD
ncbi:hypothetical protein BG000_007660 [Podila horticola]|nr:hypothetical protein BG000_007660 [Podila horticola]